MSDVRRRTGVVLLLSCPDVRSLASDSIDGDLPSSLILAFRDHLARCHPCRRLRIALVATADVTAGGALSPVRSLSCAKRLLRPGKTLVSRSRSTACLAR